MPPASRSTSRLSTAGRLARRTGPLRLCTSNAGVFSFVYRAICAAVWVGRPRKEGRRGGLVVGGGGRGVGGGWVIAGGAIIYMYRDETRQQQEGRNSRRKKSCTQKWLERERCGLAR